MVSTVLKRLRAIKSTFDYVLKVLVAVKSTEINRGIEIDQKSMFWEKRLQSRGAN